MDNAVRAILKENTELLHRYEKSEARYILQLPEDYVTEELNFDMSKEEMTAFITVLAELNLSLDEWVSFKLKELIISDRLSIKEKPAEPC